MRLKAVFVVGLCLWLGGCGSQQPKAYVSDLTSDDSLTIQLGQWDLIRYHSDKLGLDINYPSFLYHQVAGAGHQLPVVSLSSGAADRDRSGGLYP